MSEQKRPTIVVKTAHIGQPEVSDEQLNLAIRDSARKFDKVLEERKKQQEDGTHVEEFTEWK